LLRPARLVAFWTLVSIMAMLATALGVSHVAGWRTLTILSGSMAPAIEVGDLIVTRPVRPTMLAAGDIVTFRDPDGSPHLITHRVVDLQVTAAGATVETRGDANPTSERWTVPTDGTVGLGMYRLRSLGRMVTTLSSPTGRLLFIALPALALGVLWSPWWQHRPGSWSSRSSDGGSS
jgi:signal peptidase I